jgi:hypothetical protein
MSYRAFDVHRIAGALGASMDIVIVSRDAFVLRPWSLLQGAGQLEEDPSELRENLMGSIAAGRPKDVRPAPLDCPRLHRGHGRAVLPGGSGDQKDAAVKTSWQPSPIRRRQSHSDAPSNTVTTPTGMAAARSGSQPRPFAI